MINTKEETSQAKKNLIEAMKKSAGQPMTAEEVREQRINWIIGQMGGEDKAPREEVEASLDKMDGIRSE